MTELVARGEERRISRPRWTGRLRRPLLLLGVTLLCGIAYLAGIWSGMNTHVTCTTTAPGQIVCSSGSSSFTPPAPTPPPRDSASA